MSEADLREGLRAAVGDEPPLDFDADELIRRAQHVRRRRRALVAVAVATLTLTGTVLALPGVLDQRRDVDAATGSVLTTTASASAPRSAPPSASAPPSETALAPSTTEAQVAPGVKSFLSGYLSGRFNQVVPAAKVVSVDFNEVREQEPRHFTGVVRFIDGIGQSGVVVRLTTPSGREPFDRFCAEVRCDDPQRRDDGTRLATGTSTDPTSKALVARAVAHLRADGTVVQVTTYGYDPGPGSELREVALTVDQLVLLATDPNLTVP
ncbi:hypothetical protein ACQPYE_39430 [Actinosynnema sp. CA-299493]